MELSRAVKIPLLNVGVAYRNFFNSINGKRKGICSNSFRLDTTVYVTGKYINLPKIGLVKLKEKDYVPEQKYGSVSVSERAGKWFISVMREEEIVIEDTKRTKVVGIDRGIKVFAVTSKR